jgi:hypothetical protein
VSRIYFHSPSGTAEVSGRERAWFGSLTDKIGLSLVDDHYLRALAEWMDLDLYGRSVADMKNGDLVSTAHLAFRFGGDYRRSALTWRGQDVDTWTLGLNTVMALGSEPVQLAARLHAQCEIHAWVDGPNRAWLADIIDEGVETGIMRPHPDMDDIEKTGWQAVTTLLRRTDSEPVVTSYSVCEQFPNSYASTYLPPWPEGVTEEWDALTEKQQRERETLSDAWYDLPGGEQWRMGMEWLRVQRGGLELEPEGFYDFGFGNGFSWLDLTDGEAAFLAKAEARGYQAPVEVPT